jgi:hypothetical protein
MNLSPGPMSSCSSTALQRAAWNERAPGADFSPELANASQIEQVVFPSAHHSFYYSHLQPGRTMFGHWVEANGDAAADASRQMRQFLDRHLD